MCYKGGRKVEQTITYDNYEMYFLLYADGELDMAGRAMVEQFIQAQPHLKQELDMFLLLKVEPGRKVFEQKESLYKFGRYANESQVLEQLVAYIDGELPIEDRDSIAAWIEHNPAVQQEYTDLLKTVSFPDASIVFYGKKNLYKQEAARVVPFSWLRSAVAAAVLLLIAGAGYLFIDFKPTPAKNNGTLISQNNTKESKPVLTPVRETAVASNTTLPQIEKDNTIDAEPVKQAIVNAVQEKSYLPKKAIQPAVATIVNTAARLEVRTPLPSEDIAVTAAQPAQHSNITSTTEPNVHTPVQEQKIMAIPSFAVNESVELAEQPSGKLRMRGFLRKVTRVIEKRANIKATDDDDRLLIGAVAFHL